jgi:hypothetical protein
MEQRKAQQIIGQVREFAKERIAECVKENMYNKPESVLARELKLDVYEGVSKICKDEISGINFDDTAVINNDAPTEYDRFWNNDVNENSQSDSESVKNDDDDEE